MTTLALIGFKRANRRRLLRLPPYLAFAGLVCAALVIVGALSVISLSA